MKRSEVKVGMPVMLSMGRVGATRVVVTYETCDGEFMVRRRDGWEEQVSARRLGPVPVRDAAGSFVGYEHQLVGA